MTTVENLEEHRGVLTGHCYRMLGSAVEAEDAVQETILRALRGLDRFEGRASLLTWLYRIATNVCLDALAERAHRALPMDEGVVGTVDDALVERPCRHWIEPIPDERILPRNVDPSERAMLRQNVQLAFVAALQRLPPRQRAALLLVEVVGWSVAEVAESLDTTVAAVNSALQRARATLAARDASRGDGSLTEAQSMLLTRYVEAFERYDVEALTALLREDAILSMPPYTLWLRGHDSIRTWLLGRGSGCRGSRLVATAANGLPAFGQYRPAESGVGHRPWALVILGLSSDRVSEWYSFLDTETLFPLFGLPPALPA